AQGRAIAQRPTLAATVGDRRGAPGPRPALPRDLELFAPAADDQVRPAPAALAVAEEVEDLQRKEARDPRVDDQRAFLARAAPDARRRGWPARDAHLPQDRRELQPERPDLTAGEESVVPLGLVERKEQDPRLGRAHGALAVARQLVTLLHGVEVAEAG